MHGLRTGPALQRQRMRVRFVELHRLLHRRHALPNEQQHDVRLERLDVSRVRSRAGMQRDDVRLYGELVHDGVLQRKQVRAVCRTNRRPVRCGQDVRRVFGQPKMQHHQRSMCMQRCVVSHRMLQRQHVRAVRESERHFLRHGGRHVRPVLRVDALVRRDRRLRYVVRQASDTERRRCYGLPVRRLR
jgi:hypothetical protein